MKKPPKNPLFYTSRIVFILVAIVVCMYWGGPFSVQGSVARLHLDGLPVNIRGGELGLVMSGHRFACDDKLPPLRFIPEIRNRCTTVLVGKPLDLEFQIRPFEVDYCQLKYGDRAMKCRGQQDYRNRAGQADFWVEDSLNLTALDRLWIFLNNPLANILGNISEADWRPIMKIAPWSIATLLGLGIWLDSRKLFARKARKPQNIQILSQIATNYHRFSSQKSPQWLLIEVITILFGLSALLLTPTFGWLVSAVVLFTGHAD